MSFWRTLLATIARNPISFFAVVCVAATAGFLGYMTHRMTDVLESPDWCGRAIQAERISPGKSFEGLTACTELLGIQLRSLSTGLHISVGSYALTLLVLVIVVIAGARASGKFGTSGVEFNVSRHDAAEAADKVAGAAVEEAEQIKSGEAAGTYDGPAMPEGKK